MTRPPPASGDRVRARPAPSPLNPTAANAQYNGAERAALLRGFVSEVLAPVAIEAPATRFSLANGHDAGRATTSSAASRA
jgi:hypothetical protein